MKKMILWLLLFAAAQPSEAQSTRYIIRFKDKGNSPFTIANPGAYLSQRALERRQRFSIDIDSTDLPVTPRYIDSLRAAGNVTILNASKWLNSVSIQTSDVAALNKILSFPFVHSLAPIAPKLAGSSKFREATAPLPAQRLSGTAGNAIDYGNAYAQVHIHNGEFLHNIGLRGQQMRISVLDAGFQNFLTVKSLDSARSNGQIRGTWDFVAREASVNEDHSHGMQCLSVMAANIPGSFVGTAPKADYFLFRSEDAGSEYPIEEHNWVCAAERADSVGSDLISSSLGYFDFDDPAYNYIYGDMDGNTTTAAIGADLAAKKGLLVVNSAGNEGNNGWGRIITPADGDSVLAVGAVTRTGEPASFTSRGPSSDGQVKPDVASVGVATVVQLPNNTIGTNNGTSFACPNMAGLTACLWQGFPEVSNYRIIEALRAAGSKADAPDNIVGYGIPDVRKSVMALVKEFAAVEVSQNGCTATLSWTSKDMSAMKYQVERQLPGGPGFTTIATIDGTGSVFGTRQVSFIDNLSDLPVGTVNYRIRQVIDTAAAGMIADYIGSASFQLQQACISGNTALVAAPNPTNGPLQVRLNTPEASENIVLRLTNAKGQILVEQKKTKAAGMAIYEMSTYHLPAGHYYLTVFQNNSKVLTATIIKL